MRLRKLLFSLLMILLVHVSYASHIQGIQMYYKHVSGTSYEVTIHFYRYCGGNILSPNGVSQAAANAPTSMYLEHSVPAYSYLANYTVNLDTIYELNMFCPNYSGQSTCNGGYTVGMAGFQVAIYRDTIDFNNSTVSGDGLLICQTSARNSGTNYFGQPGISIYTTFNPASGNSSAKPLSAELQLIFSDSVPYQMPFTAFDPDGDSLVYELDTAISSISTINGAMNYITYNSAIQASGLFPIPNCSMDASTGILNAVPYIPPGYNNANYAVAYKIKEYNPVTGALKAVTQNDVQFIVIGDSSVTIPQQVGTMQNVLGANSFTNNSLEVCASTYFSLDLTYEDSTALYGVLEYDSTELLASVSQTGTNPATFHITGVILDSTAINKQLNLKIYNNTCPFSGTTIHSITINTACSNQVNDTLEICSNQSISFDYSLADSVVLNVLSGSALTGSTYLCTNASCTSFELSPDSTTSYAITTYSGVISIQDTFVIVVNQIPTISLNYPGSICFGDSQSVEVSTTNPASFTVNWVDNNGLLNSNFGNSVMVIGDTIGSFELTYQINISNICFDTGNINITVAPIPTFNGFTGLSNQQCYGSTDLIAANGGYNLIFTPSTNVSSYANVYQITYLDTISYDVEFIDPITNCSAHTTFDVNPISTIIQGTAVDTAQTAITSGYAVLFELDTANSNIISTTTSAINAVGEFSFANMSSTSIIGVYPGSAYDQILLPTYYNFEPYIQNAALTSFNYCASTVYNHVVIPAPANITLDSGVISGHVNWAASSAPVPNLSVFLTDTLQNIVQNTSTDANGFFEFDEVNAGNYLILLDHWGIDNSQAPEISIASGQIIDSLQFLLYADHLELLAPTYVESLDHSTQISIYPNPSSDVFIINSSSVIEYFEVVDSFGRIVMFQNIQKQTFDINLAQFENGIYFLKMKSKEGKPSSAKLLLVR